MLHKVGAEDNVSFYQNKSGKSDFILNLQWHAEFDKSFQRHLSSVTEYKNKDVNQQESEQAEDN
jgi:hypothetical protein